MKSKLAFVLFGITRFIIGQRKQEMKPPWIEFPDYPPGCLGWRMGIGEDYIDNWYKYISDLTIEDKKIYFNQYPIPIEWEKINIKKEVLR